MVMKKNLEAKERKMDGGRNRERRRERKRQRESGSEGERVRE